MKRANGSGGVSYEKSRNKYRATFVTPAGRSVLRRFTTKREALDWLAVRRSERLQNTYIEPSDLTLGSWLIKYLCDYKTSTIAPKTMDLYTLLARKCAPLSEIKLQSFTANTVQGFYSDLRQAGQSTAMIRKVHAFLSAALKKARQIGLTSVNIMDAVEPPAAPPKPKLQTFTNEETTAIYNAAKEYAHGRYYPFILLAFHTGARKGELMALFWDCIDFQRSEITIRRNLTLTQSAGLRIGAPKTKSGIRTFSVSSAVMAALRTLRSGKLVSFNGPIFTTASGNTLQPRNIDRMWHDILRRAGVPYRNFHVIRHTHATELLSAGVPIADISRRIGHSKISHTLDLYSHAIPRNDKVIASKLELIFGR